jgi:hypothetical protein
MALGKAAIMMWGAGGKVEYCPCFLLICFSDSLKVAVDSRVLRVAVTGRAGG